MIIVIKNDFPIPVCPYFWGRKLHRASDKFVKYILESLVTPQNGTLTYLSMPDFLEPV